MPAPPPPGPPAPAPSAPAILSRKTQARHARQQQQIQTQQHRSDLTNLHAAQRALVAALRDLTATHTRLLASLGHLEAENERWQTSIANLGELYRLKDEVERVEKRVRECHRRWDELAVEIEEKHDEIAFGGD